jgi:predicted GNAT superfamily acetyltransferase
MAEDFVRDTYGVDSVEKVETRHFEGQEQVQEAMMNSWGSTGMPEEELIPTYEFESKEQGGNLITLEKDGSMALAYMFPDPERPEAVYSHAVGVESHDSNIGTEIKTRQRDEVLESGHKIVYWTVDPLKPLNNRLNTTKLGGKAREYKQDVYNTETSGGTPADRFVVEWDIRSDRVDEKVSALEEGTRDYVRDDIHEGELETVLSAGEELPDYGSSLIEKTDAGYSLPEIPEGPVAVEIPREPVEDMDRVAEEEWRYATRAALENLMDEGYEVTELMVPGESGFDQNTYVLEQ